MKKKTVKIETWLPIFPGFYGTLFEPDETDFLEENDVNYDDIEFDNSEYEKDIAESCCNFLSDELKGFISGIAMQAVCSPRYYNYGNDAINVEIQLTKANLEALRAYLVENRGSLSEYLKERYTSRSGFVSSYSPHYAMWSEYTEGFTNWNENGHHLGSMLEFICQNEEITHDDMYYRVQENVYVDDYCSIKEAA